MHRVHPPSRLCRAVALAGLCEHGLPSRVDLGSSALRETYFDFSKLSEPQEIEDIPGARLLQIGTWESWLPALGVRPPGRPVALDPETGWIYRLQPGRSARVDVQLINTSAGRLEDSTQVYAEFSLDRSAKGVLALSSSLRQIEPSFTRPTTPRSFWQEIVEGLFVDWEIDEPLRWA